MDAVNSGGDYQVGPSQCREVALIEAIYPRSSSVEGYNSISCCSSIQFTAMSLFGVVLASVTQSLCQLSFRYIHI